MFGRFLIGLVLCATIGSAVGAYVDRGEIAVPVLEQGPVAMDSAEMLTCLDRARAQLDRLDPQVGYLERDLRRACALTTETSVVSHYRRTWSGAPAVTPQGAI